MKFILTILITVMISEGSDLSQNERNVFQEEIGEIIDAEENSQYNFFGDLDSFVAATLYTESINEYSLHVLRNHRGHVQLLIIQLSADEFIDLLQKIRLRYNQINENISIYAVPAFQIDESSRIGNDTNRKIVLRDGSEIIGTLQDTRNDTLVVSTAGGLYLHIPDDQISHTAELRGEFVEGELVRHDPNSTRLFFAPTARNIRGGSGYFADYMVLFPTFAYGITDNAAISGGITLIPGADAQAWFLAPKVSYNVTPQVDVALGAFFLDIPGNDNAEFLGYSVITYGDRLKSLTLGFSQSLESNSEDGQILIVGGDLQISNRSKLVTENWIFLHEDKPQVFSAGIRFFGERMAVDLAFISAEEMWEDGSWPLMPWVDFSILLGD